MLIYPTDDMKSMIELMVVYVATMYVVVVGQVWWFGVLSLMSLFATVGSLITWARGSAAAQRPFSGARIPSNGRSVIAFLIGHAMRGLPRPLHLR
jgi:hypothetical protein